MKLGYLGDSLDFAKGRLLLTLEGEGALNSCCVAPMFNDWAEWSDASLRLYARLLGRTLADLVPAEHHQLFPTNRSLYFSKVSDAVGGRDLFLDPCTGLAPTKSGDEHVEQSDILALVREHPRRVVVSYQHGGQGRDQKGDVAAWKQGSSRLRSVRVAVYHGQHAAFLFFTRDEARMDGLLRVLTEFDPRSVDESSTHAKRRVEHWRA